jgi:uncharacterized membrane protein (UPF0182 family)
VQARRWLLIALAIAAVVLLVGRAATALYVDHAWYTAMGAPALFWERVLDTAILQGGAWIVGSVFAFANLHAVRRTILAVAMPSRVANIELTAMVPGRRLFTATVVAAMLVSAVLATPVTNWADLALVRHGVPFGEIEGILDHDLGHYLYWLPLEETLYLWALVSLVSLTAMVLVLYALTRSLRLEGRRLAASNHVRRHLSVLGCLVLLLLAWSYRLDAFDLLRQGSGPDGLFLNVDHRVTLRVDFLLSYGAGIAAFIILRTGWVGQMRAAFVTLSVVLAATVGLRHLLPAVVTRGDLLGDRNRRDRDYLAARALFSRRAFDVDAMRIVGTDSGTGSPLPLPVQALRDHASLWDRDVLGRGLGSVAGENATSASGAGGLVDAAPVGWTRVDGHIAALRVRRPLASSDEWSLAVVDVTRPDVRDHVIELSVERAGSEAGAWPLIGPGVEGTRLLDQSRAPDIPAATLTTRPSRIAHAWALRDVALLEGDSATMASPVLVTHRDVRDRLRRLAPVFVQGDDVLPLRDGDRFYWVVQLYSASDRYPLSQRWQIAGGIYSYFKLAATALVDARTGRVQLVPVAKPDAIARTWMARLPALFTPAAALPSSLVAQLPMPTESAVAQIRTFARYGSRLDGPVLRHLPDSALVGGAPAPFIVGESAAATTAWSVPLLDAGDQLEGVATAVGGADRATWWLATPSPRPRWSALRNQLQATLDSAQAAVPESARRETRLTAGRVEPLVTTRGVLLMQTVRTTGGDGRVVITRVGITDGERVGIGSTVAEALAGIGALTSPGRPGARPGSASSDEPAAGTAARLYESMKQAMRRGDWNGFGVAFDSLGRVLQRPPQ